MILMEEHIHEIMLLCLPPHMDKIVERIMEVMIENHLACKCRIQDQSIQAPQEDTQFQAVLSKEPKEYRRDGYQHH